MAAIEAEQAELAQARGRREITLKMMLAANAGLEERLSELRGQLPARRSPRSKVARLVGRPGELRGRWGDLSVDDRRSVVASVVERVVVSRMLVGASRRGFPAGDRVEIAYRPWLAGERAKTA